MIDNATLNSIALPGVPNVWGDSTAQSATTESVRCTIDEPTFSQRMEIGQIVEGVTAVLYVLKSALPAGVKPVQHATLVITADDGVGQTFVVELLKDLEKAGGLSHYQCYLRMIP